MSKKTLADMLLEIGNGIREERFKKRMSQDDVARLAGTSSVLICNLEKNKLQTITLNKLKSITDALEMDLSITCK